MNKETAVTAEAADHEIITNRLINAPRALVFKVWTDPDHIGEWWGPNGFTTTTHEMDVRPEGVWRFIMHGPDGRDYPNRITFHEVIEPERLVYSHDGDVDSEPVTFRTTVTFEDVDGKTALSMRAVLPTVEERNRVVKEYGAIEGAQQTLARLAEYIERM